MIDATWTTCEDFDYARGVYDGEFGGGKLFAVHTREVRFCKPDFFCIYDTIRASDGQPHRFDLLFHIDTPKVDPVPEIPGAFLSDIGRTYDVLVVPVPIPGESAEDVRAVSGQTEPNYLGWYVGRDERDQHIATTLLRSSQPTAGHRFMTLIFPVRRGDPLPTVTTTADGLVRVLTGGKEYLLDRENLCG